jgi:hypothetical protein
MIAHGLPLLAPDTGMQRRISDLPMTSSFKIRLTVIRNAENIGFDSACNCKLLSYRCAPLTGIEGHFVRVA